MIEMIINICNCNSRLKALRSFVTRMDLAKLELPDFKPYKSSNCESIQLTEKLVSGYNGSLFPVPWRRAKYRKIFGSPTTLEHVGLPLHFIMGSGPTDFHISVKARSYSSLDFKPF